MTVIVTGATSFIGRAAVKELLVNGENVLAVSRPASAGAGALQELFKDLKQQAEQKGESIGNLELCFCELGEIERLEKIYNKEKLQAKAWLHLGWDGAGSDKRKDVKLQEKNIGYAIQALYTAAALGCSRFLFSGSQAEYGICDSWMKEEQQCHPVSEYGKDKVLVYQQASKAAKELGVDYIHTRIFSVYGPGDHPWSLIKTCIRTFLSGGHMEMGPCTQQWNFLYVGEAARILVKLLLGKAAAGVYNVAGEDTRPLKEYIEELFMICGEKGSYEFGYRPPNAEGCVSLMPELSKLKNAIGFHQQVSFKEGILETIKGEQVK